MSLLIKESMDFVSNKWQVMGGNYPASFYDEQLFLHLVGSHDILLLESELRNIKRAANKELVELVLKHFNLLTKVNEFAFIYTQNEFDERLLEITKTRTDIYDYINRVYGEYVYA